MYSIAAPSLEKCGDGMALCYWAGCTLQDMEMYQFHPTGLVAGSTIITGAVLEEGLRGVGGRLLNNLGERYMERYDPERMERSTRDMVSRAGYMEIQAGRGTPDGAVMLDVSHLGAEFVEKSFPGMVARCREVGFDLAREPVKVSPTAHFHMGGVRIDEYCRSGLDRLFVAGEDSGGVHGANRLGGNGVAESTVFGAIAGDAMAEFVVDRTLPAVDQREVEAAVIAAMGPFGGSGNENIFSIRQEIESLMWDKGGIVRNGPDLEAVIASLDELGTSGRAGAGPGSPPVQPSLAGVAGRAEHHDRRPSNLPERPGPAGVPRLALPQRLPGTQRPRLAVQRADPAGITQAARKCGRRAWSSPG